MMITQHVQPAVNMLNPHVVTRIMSHYNKGWLHNGVLLPGHWLETDVV